MDVQVAPMGLISKDLVLNVVFGAILRENPNGAKTVILGKINITDPLNLPHVRPLST